MISKELFVSVLDGLREQYERDRRNSEVVSKMFSCNSSLYDNGILVASVIRLLQQWFPKDEDGFCEIEHWCFEREYGKVILHDMENGGYEVERETADMLYDRLTSNRPF